MKDVLINKTPASWHRDLWREATPLGSGLLGALVYGHVAKETIAVNHARLWHRGEEMPVPDIGPALAEARRLIDEKQYYEGSWAITKALKDTGYKARLAMPLPLCDITMDLGERAPFAGYRRYLHMDRGESVVSWNENGKPYSRSAFLSRECDLLAVRFRAPAPVEEMILEVNYHETGEPDTESMLKDMKDSFEYLCEPPFIAFSAVSCAGVPFGAVVRVDTDGAVYPWNKASVRIENATQTTLLARFFVGEGQSARGLMDELQSMTDGYDALLARHAALHGLVYHSADLSLGQDQGLATEDLLAAAYEDEAPAELLQKMWRFGRYLMACGTRGDSNPFPLYGLWHGRYSMAWPHNMANENVQMIYWHVLCGGMADAMPALIRYYAGHMEQFRTNARHLFGLPGIYLPAGTTPGMAVPNQIVPVIMDWIGCAGWLSQHFYDYYRYTGDEELLRETILPFMAEAAEFYCAYVVMGEDGFYKVYPSVSPENTPGNLMPPKGSEPMAHPCPGVINATMDVAIIKELLSNLLRASAHTGLYADHRGKWQQVLDHMPPYQTTPEGNVREWMHEDLEENYHHRHLSHLYPVFPGTEVVKGRDEEAWLNAFELAVDKRHLGAQSGWSLAHMACLYARFERGEKAIACLDHLTRSCLHTSLFTLHNDWRNMGLSLGRGPFAPVQLDAAMGAVNAIQEMLLFSACDTLKLLPALPQRFCVGNVRDLRFATGRVSMEWNASEGRLAFTLTADRDTDVQVLLPPFARSVRLEDGTLLRSGDRIPLAAGQKICGLS